MLLLFFFSILAVLARANEIVCSEDNPCYGTPWYCQPETDCDVLFQFNQYGGLDVTIRNVTDGNGFVAIALRIEEDVVMEHLICIPHYGKRLRVFSVPGQPINIIDTNVAESVPENNNMCTFPNSELPDGFQSMKKFVVSTGIFSEDMVIPKGYELSSLISDYTFHNIAASMSRPDTVMTPDESKLATDLLGKMERISSIGDNDIDLESLFDKAEEESEDEEESDSDDSFSNNNEMKPRNGNEGDSDEDQKGNDRDDKDMKKVNPKKNDRKQKSKNGDDDDQEDEESDDNSRNSEAGHPYVYTFALLSLVNLLAGL